MIFRPLESCRLSVKSNSVKNYVSLLAVVFSFLFLFTNNLLARDTPFTEYVMPFNADGACSVYAADVDGDGDLDALSASDNNDTVAWYENNGNGTYTPHNVTTSAIEVCSVYAVDVDGDGDADALSASYGDDAISWYENDGSQNFTKHDITNTAVGANNVYAADVDGDGDIDALSASNDDNTVAWYENDGAQNFTKHVITNSADCAMNVQAVDMDGDGDMDALTASYGDNTIAWYENDGNQNFTKRDISTTAFTAIYAYAADMDGDGDMDALAALGEYGRVVWYENNGSQYFSARDITTNSPYASGVYASDVDGDGDMDALSSSYADDTVSWYENDGNENFTKRDISVGAGGVIGVYAADMDGDGDIDPMSASYFSNEITLYENRTIHQSAVFPQQTVISSEASSSHSISVHDLDGDGDIDVVSGGEDVLWHENNGNQNFWADKLYDGNASTLNSSFPCDIDRDGDVDLLMAGINNFGLRWYTNNNNQTFSSTTIDPSNFYDAFAYDMDGDGDMDIVAAGPGDRLSWYENNGSQIFSANVIDSSIDDPRSVFVLDIDRDGDADVLSASENDDTIAWYENNGSQSFTKRIISSNADGARSALALDVDRDGDVDAIAVSSRDDTIAWYENDGAQNFTLRVVSNLADGVRDVFGKDLDLDGDIDILYASYEDDTVGWYENNGSQSFSAHTITSSLDGAYCVAVADIDRDGDPDVAAASANSGVVEWYANQGGQFALATVDTAPANMVDDELDDLLKVTVDYRGRTGDTDIELASIKLLFEESTGDPLTTAEANALIDFLYIYKDDGSGSFESGSDSLVLTENSLILTDGVQAVSFSNQDANVRLSYGNRSVYFIVVKLTGDARNHTPGKFQVTHVTESGSSARDRDYGILLRLEYATTVTSSSINPANAPPVITEGASVSVTMDEDGSPTAFDLVLNAQDQENDAITWSVSSAASNGYASASGTGYSKSIGYTPNSNYNGSDSFEVSVTDGNGGADSITVNVTITPQPDNPVAVNDSASTVEETAVTIDVLANDTDVDGDTLTVGAVTQGANGTVTNHTNNVTYAPNANFTGSDSFTYTVSDGAGGADTATVSVSVNDINEAPTDIALSAAAVNENSAAGTVVGALSCTDPDTGDTHIYSLLNNADGLFAVSGDRLIVAGALDYETASSHLIQIRVTDRGNLSYAKNFTIAVININDAPSAVNDEADTIKDNSVSISVLSNDFDQDGDAFSITSYTNGSYGTTQINGTNIVYTPNTGYTGTDTFTYTIDDGNLTDSATVRVNVLELSVEVGNDRASDFGEACQLQATISGGKSPITYVWSIQSGPNIDASQLSDPSASDPSASDPSFTPTHIGTYVLECSVTDSLAQTASDAVRIQTSNRPSIQSQTFDCMEDTPVAISLNATDVDGDALNFAIVGNPTNGVISNFNETAGTLIYTPRSNYSGSDSFTCTATDGVLTSNPAVITVRVINSDDDPPVASDLSYTLKEDSSKRIKLRAYDRDGGVILFEIDSYPKNGKIPDFNRFEGILTYIPSPDFSGEDSFTYHVYCPAGGGPSVSSTVSLSVEPVNDPPSAQSQTLTCRMDNPLSCVLSAADVDTPDGCLVFSIISDPANGFLSSMESHCSLTYYPNSGFTGTDSFRFSVSDGEFHSDATVTIDVVQPEPTQTPTPNQTVTPMVTPTPTVTPTPEPVYCTVGGGTYAVTSDKVFTIPLEAYDLPRLNRFSFEMVYDPLLIEFQEIVKDGSIVEEWPYASSVRVTDGRISIAGFSNFGDARNGNGVLLYCKFRSKPFDTADETYVSLESFSGIDSVRPLPIQLLLTEHYCDLNSDGVVDDRDVEILFNYIMNLQDLTDEQIAMSDLDGDGEITIVDVKLLYDMVLGMSGSDVSVTSQGNRSYRLNAIRVGVQSAPPGK